MLVLLRRLDILEDFLPARKGAWLDQGSLHANESSD